MKIADGVALKPGVKVSGARVEIPDCTREDLPLFFVEQGYRVGVEIGVEKGFFSQLLLAAGLEVYCVDPWIHNSSWSYTRPVDEMAEIERFAQKNLARFPKAHVVKATSMQAVEHFADGSLDFVYIDGNHEFRYVAEDLQEWVPKVRKGGTVSGHDYFTPKSRPRPICSVTPVLHAYIGWFAIPRWYVLGSKRGRPGERREPHRSWFWIKE